MEGIRVDLPLLRDACAEYLLEVAKMGERRQQERRTSFAHISRDGTSVQMIGRLTERCGVESSRLGGEGQVIITLGGEMFLYHGWWTDGDLRFVSFSGSFFTYGDSKIWVYGQPLGEGLVVVTDEKPAAENSLPAWENPIVTHIKVRYGHLSIELPVVPKVKPILCTPDEEGFVAELRPFDHEAPRLIPWFTIGSLTREFAVRAEESGEKVWVIGRLTGWVDGTGIVRWYANPHAEQPIGQCVVEWERIRKWLTREIPSVNFVKALGLKPNANLASL